MNLFYHHSIEFQFLNEGEYFIMPEEETQHAIRVLRLKENDVVHVTDGKGFMVESTIMTCDKKSMNLKINSKIFSEKRNFKCVIAIAPTKNPGRMEWFLEKSTEIGIDEIIPIICEHSEKKNFNSERMNKVITAAVKQSLQSYHPKLRDLISFTQLLNMPFDGKKIIAHYDPENPHFLKDLITKQENIMVIIGPEGDFSKKELLLAEKKNIASAILGHNRLRTETAALNACMTINLVNQ